MAEAIYFHATLYRFAPTAFNEVILRFNTAIEDVSARCWYDTQQDVFCLTSPSPIGQQANTALKDVLSDYVDEELATAEREDRPPAITVFPDMLYEGESAEHTDLAHVSMLNQPESSLKLPHCNNNVATNIILHSVNLENSSNSVINIFRLSQLPAGLVDRILSANDTGSTTAIKYGMTARTVRWDSRNEVYIFNGRVGSPIHLTTSPNAQVLSTSRFTAMSDNRISHTSAREDDDVPIKTFSFVNGENPGVNRFIQWMGNIVEDDPEVKPEEPEDASKFLAHSNLTQPPQGRARVPKTTAVADSDDESGDSDDESERSAPTIGGNGSSRSADNNISANNIMHIFGLTAPGKQDTTNNMTSSSSKTVVGGRREAVTIHNTSPFSRNPTTATSAKPVCEPDSCTSSRAASGNSGASDRKSTDRSLSGHNGSSTTGHGIPTYDRNYANVDRIGLGGHAANQATWEHENVAPKKNTTNRSGIARRQVLTTTDSTQPLLPTRIGSSATSTVSYVPSSSFPYNDDPPSSQRWTNIITQPQPAGEMLIDFACSVRGSQTISMPPGLEEYGRTDIHSHSRDYLPASTQSIAAVQYGKQGAEALVGSSENPKGVSKTGSMLSPPGVQPTILQKLAAVSCSIPPHSSRLYQGQSVPAEPHNMEARRTASDNDRITELLQIAPDDSKLKRYTMGQKASKKSKKPYKKLAPVKAVLPKPDPIPPPRSNKSRKEATASHSAVHSPSRLQAQNQSLGSSPDKDKEPSASSSPPMTAIEELLRDTISSNVLEGAVINASFGMILMRQTEPKDLLKGAVTKEKFQTRLRAAGDSLRTSFFPRLTTSTSDALFLLDMIPGSSVRATVEYEGLVKNAEGSIRIIKINQCDRSNVQVVCPDSTPGTTYIHYPLRIWDAKVIVEASRFDSSMTEIATKFVSSMQTLDEAPSFVAMLPPASFGIDKVYAKRLFSKAVADGVEMKVVEIQELQLLSIDSERYNVKATALSAADMINGQRLWWECGLTAQIVDSGSAATLQAVIDKMVSQMDGVGYGNTGPWTKDQVEVNGQSVASPEPPFW